MEQNSSKNTIDTETYFLELKRKRTTNIIEKKLHCMDKINLKHGILSMKSLNANAVKSQ